jgi:hypothetical protein
LEYGESVLKVEKNRRRGELRTIKLTYEKQRLFENEND